MTADELKASADAANKRADEAIAAVQTAKSDEKPINWRVLMWPFKMIGCMYVLLFGPMLIGYLLLLLEDALIWIMK